MRLRLQGSVALVFLLAVPAAAQQRRPNFVDAPGEQLGCDGCCPAQRASVTLVADASFVLLADYSGSMADGGKWKSVVDGVNKFLLDAKAPQWNAISQAAEGAIARFSGCGGVVIPRLRSLQSMSGLAASKPKGSTPLAEALHEARKRLANAKGSKAVLIATDGSNTCDPEKRKRSERDFTLRVKQFETRLANNKKEYNLA